MTDANQLPPLPALLRTRVVDGVPCISVSEHEYQMREYALQAIAKATHPAEVSDDLQSLCMQVAESPEVEESLCHYINDESDTLTIAWLVEVVLTRARAILALRPVQVPMTDDEIFNAYCKSDSTLNTHITNLVAFARAVEVHHGITAQAKKEDE